MSDPDNRYESGVIESPFLSDELFAGESPVEAPAFFSRVIDESPFLQFSPEAEIEEEVIGKDDRVLVTDTLRIPNRWICAIDILIDNPRWGSSGEPRFLSQSRGTGILIGPRHVLTVAHIRRKQSIEIDGNTQSVDVKGYTVGPARNGDNSKGPFGKVTSKAIQVSQPYQVLRKVMVDSKIREIPIRQQDDYALLVLEKDLSPGTGYWGENPSVAVLKRLDPNEINGKEIVIIGYPGDTCGKEKFSGSRSEKERKISNCWIRRNNEWASTQWRSAGTLEAAASSTTVLHTADTYEGQSGAPICLPVDKKLHLAAIHTHKDNPQRNKGVRVTRRMLREICSWMNADAGYTIATINDDTLIVQPTKPQAARESEYLHNPETEEDQSGEQEGRISEFETENSPGEDLMDALTFDSEDSNDELDSADEWESDEESDEAELEEVFDETEEEFEDEYLEVEEFEEEDHYGRSHDIPVDPEEYTADEVDDEFEF